MNKEVVGVEEIKESKGIRKVGAELAERKRHWGMSGICWDF